MKLGDILGDGAKVLKDVQHRLSKKEQLRQKNKALAAARRSGRTIRYQKDAEDRP